MTRSAKIIAATALAVQGRSASGDFPGLLPPLVFLILYRFAFDTPASWRRERISVYLTDLGILVTATVLVLTFGEGAALVQLPTSIDGVPGVRPEPAGIFESVLHREDPHTCHGGDNHRR